MGLRLGAGVVAKLYRGSAAVQKLYLGASLVWQAAVLSAMGMNKSDTQVVNAGVWTKVTGWSVRSGYPATVIVDDELVADGAGTVTVNAGVRFGGIKGDVGLRILVNGAVVQTFNTSDGNTASGTHSVALVSGDTVEVEALRGSGSMFQAFRTISTSDTYLYWNAP